MKRTISIILAMAMVLSMATISVGANESMDKLAKRISTLDALQNVEIGAHSTHYYRTNIREAGTLNIEFSKQSTSSISFGIYSGEGDKVYEGSLGSFSQATKIECELSKGGTYYISILNSYHLEDKYNMTVGFTRATQPELFITHTLRRGGELRLGAEMSNNEKLGTITWRSSRTSVATVSNSGVVRARSAGIVTITAVTLNGYSAKVRVRVVDR
ncbi:MAG: Ig-like domain-containing protein [Oscillospiraceae bacterium]|nr:Ig-like domain-containing protein [Oscillospiraceae bacterium]